MISRPLLQPVVFALLALSWPGLAAAAEPARAWVEVAGTLYNPDWEFRENGTGLRLTGVWLPVGNIQLRGTYNTIDTNEVNLPVRGLRGLPFGNWRELGAGYVWRLNPATSLTPEVSYQGVDLYDGVESGYAIGTTVKHRFSKRIETSLKVSYLELEISDWRLTGEVVTSLSPGLDLVARLDDFAEFDFTWYEVGVRFSFQ